MNLEKRKIVTEEQNEMIKDDIVLIEDMVYRLSKLHRLKPKKFEESKNISYQQNDATRTTANTSIGNQDRSEIEERKHLDDIVEETGSCWIDLNEDIKFDKDSFKHRLVSNLKKQYPDHFEHEMPISSPAFVQCKTLGTSVKKLHPKFWAK